MQKAILLIALAQFFLAEVTSGQSTNTSTPAQLLLQIKISRPDTNRVKLDLELGDYYLNKRGEYKNNEDSAYAHFDAAMQLSKFLRSTKWQNNTLIHEADYYIKTGDVKRAKICFSTVTNYYKSGGDKKNEALTWKKAADFFDPENKATNDDQLKYYSQAVTLFRQTGDKLNETQSLESIANIHLNQKKFDIAQTELLQVLDQYKSINYKSLQHTYDLLGDVSKGKIDLHKELFYRLKAIKSMEAANDTVRAAYYYARAALVYADLGEYRQSANLIMKSLEILKHNDPEADFYVYNVKKSQDIADLMVRYQTENKEQSIKILKSESKNQQAHLQKANLQRNITFGAIIMMIVISGFVYNGYRNKQKNNQLLESKQGEINRQNRKLQLLLDDKDKLLAEKDWLLKEVHHRVKNNLQIVMSLLNTQSAYLESNAAITAIRESQNRVQAISLIHQRLYSTSNVASIDMKAYITDLANYLRDCLDTIARQIRFEIEVEDIRIDLTQAVPLGLILNEAVTNAIKYAFDENGGNIIIGLQWVADKNLLLKVADDGKGLPEEFDVTQATSLGMELMKALSKQLGGSFELRNKPGVTVMIDFQAERIIDEMPLEKSFAE